MWLVDTGNIYLPYSRHTLDGYTCIVLNGIGYMLVNWATFSVKCAEESCNL